MADDPRLYDLSHYHYHDIQYHQAEALPETLCDHRDDRPGDQRGTGSDNGECVQYGYQYAVEDGVFLAEYQQPDRQLHSRDHKDDRIGSDEKPDVGDHRVPDIENDLQYMRLEVDANELSYQIIVDGNEYRSDHRDQDAQQSRRQRRCYRRYPAEYGA